MNTRSTPWHRQERDEQLRLSAEVKAAHDESLQRAEEGTRSAQEQLQAAKAEEAKLRSTIESERGLLADAKRDAEAAGLLAKEAATAREAAVAAQEAAVAAVKVELATAKEGEDRAQTRYRTELANHSHDMQALHRP